LVLHSFHHFPLAISQLGRIPVGFSIVLADKAFGQANDAEILVIVTVLTLALTVDIPGGPMCSM